MRGRSRSGRGGQSGRPWALHRQGLRATAASSRVAAARQRHTPCFESPAEMIETKLGGVMMNFATKSSLLADRYRLEAPLGHGTASVFRAVDLRTGSRCAIKRLPRDAALADGEHERFVHEVTLLSQLCHLNIVTMTALHRDDSGRSLLVMELLEGEDALVHLAGGQRLPLPRVLAITRQVAAALHAAHRQGITHREFQLSSIFLAMQRGLGGASAEVVKLVGFGGVKLRALPGPLTRRGTLGVTEYRAPEGMPGRQSELDHSSDQWSVAVAVYRMLSGQLPFRAADEESLQTQICESPPSPLSELCPELPQHVVATITRALSKDKAQRFSSMAEFMRALSGQTSPVAAVPGPPVVLAAPAPKSPPVALPASPSGERSERPQQASRSCVPRPTTMSDLPTLAVKVELEQTRNIEPAVLAALCAQSQQLETRSLPNPVQDSGPVKPAAALALPAAIPPPPLPGSWLLRERGRKTPRRETLVLVLGSCVGLSLGMSAAWLLGQHLAKPERRQLPPGAAAELQGKQSAVADAAILASRPQPLMYRRGLGGGTYRVCVQTSGLMDLPWGRTCRPGD